jgi:diguanylate cyclase (GGDEF)-like protein
MTALLAAGVLLGAAPRTRWLRVHAGAGPLTKQMIALRVVASGVLAGAAVVALGTALGPASLGLSEQSPLGGLLRIETLAAIGLVLLLVGLESDPPRRWLLLGASVAAATAWLGMAWISDAGALHLPSCSFAALTAATIAALALCPGPTGRLVSRIRRATDGSPSDHVVLHDAKDRIVYMSEAARDALGLRPPERSLLPKRAPLPKALRKLVADPNRSKARMRTSAGSILEGRIVRAAEPGLLKRTGAITIRDVTSEYRDERRLMRLAHYDSLTGLANRRLFLESLKNLVDVEEGEPKPVALLYIDLDGFKAINDSLGHSAGDALLKALADRFHTRLSAEYVARFGVSRDERLVAARLAGDEFAVIAPGIADGESAGELARYVIEMIGRPVSLMDTTIAPSASVGIALHPEDGDDVEMLLRHADSALYVAKRRGRRRFARYEASFDAKADRAALIETGLRAVLDHKELRLNYQPLVDARSRELIGFEALLRWTSPELGDVGPAEFIPVAEARGLISKIGAWCLDEACRQMGEWKDAGLEIVPVSVNVSSAQFAEADLQRDVNEALKRYNVDPALLVLELTESLLLDERNHAEQILRDIRSIGVRIALDDFGTGYSALSYLNRFSLDSLKIDRDLLRDIDSDPSALGIVSAVVSMAHSLDLSVVAEGVDMEEQVPILQGMGCDHIQGFLFAPALPASEVSRFIARAGQARLSFGPGMSIAGTPGSSVREQIDDLDDIDEPVLKSDSDAELATEPVLRDAPEPVAAQAAAPLAAEAPDRGRLLLIDDGHGCLGTVAMRLGHLGVDIHYASEIDEAHLFIAQERDAIRVIAVPPTLDLEPVCGILDAQTEESGERRRLIVIGAEPDEEKRLEIRAANVDWVLWAPFNDAELRYVVRSAMARKGNLATRHEIRVPVDITANVWSGDRREMAVVSSLSSRGAFIELSEPLERDSTLRLEMDLGGDRFRGFARVVHVHPEDPERPNEPSGIGVSFYGTDRDEDRLLRKAIGELEARYRA